MRGGIAARVVAVGMAVGLPPWASGQGIRHVRADRGAGTSAAVVVGGEVALVHTAQILPADAEGRVVGGGRAEEQVAAALDRLDAALERAGAGLERVVRLHVVAASEDVLPAVREAVAGRWPGGDGPALTLVVGGLARPGALVGIDAVATIDARPEPGRVERLDAPDRGGQLAGSGMAVLPGGPRVSVSGQAERADDLAGATRATLEGLGETLEHLGLGREHVVQVKAFFLPPESAGVVERACSAFFGEGGPPLVLVEWQSTLPIEIELIAAAPDAGSDEAIDYLATPTLEHSPIFSRVARVNRGDPVYVSGLYGPEGATGAAQVEAIFDELGAILAEAGGDLRHLAKATYYVADDEASRALNELRPSYYDPSRPPAASKAIVPGVGLGGRTVSVDMIAVVPGGEREGEGR